jgi:hypothetical protein
MVARRDARRGQMETEGGKEVLAMIMRYLRYALTSLATVAFGLATN